MIIGPPSNQVSCTPQDLGPTHIAACSQSGGSSIHTISLANLIAQTGSWTQLFSSFVAASRGLVCDLEDGIIFGARGSGTFGEIVKCNADGSGIPSTIYSGNPLQTQLAINPEANLVFYGRTSTSLRSITYEGTVVTIASPSRMNGLWYDAVGDWIYWTDSLNDAICRVRPDGSEMNESWKTGLDIAVGPNPMTGDGTIGKLWWADETDGLYETDIATKEDTLLVAERTEISSIVYYPGEDVLLYTLPTSGSIRMYDRGTASESILFAQPTSTHRSLALIRV